MDSEFSLKGYQTLLETGLRNGYRFILFHEANQSSDPNALEVIMRHDIDCSIAAACRIAEVEHALGIRSTYFFMLRSPLYNLFSRDNTRLVQQVLSLGHEFGFHYDRNFLPDEDSSHDEWLEEELQSVERLFRVTVKVVSYHQPGPDVLNGLSRPKRVLNAYDRVQFGQYKYMADSNCRWRECSPRHVFEKQTHRKLQLLTHPIWWAWEQPGRTEDKWNWVIADNFQRAQQQLLETEPVYGPERQLVICEKR